MNHILNGCPWVFERNKMKRLDRFTWRHNGVLRVLVNFLWRHVQQMVNLKAQDSPCKKVTFVHSGQKIKKKESKFASGILLLAKDWLFHMDLPEFVEEEGQFRVPHDIVLTDLRPDILLISRKEKIVIIIELSCPNDKNLEYWRKKKRDIYAKLKRWVAYG